MNFDKTLFRCSSIGHLMCEPKTKAEKEAGELSETAKTHLIDVYVSAKYGRQTDISNKYIEKGNAVEEDSITLFSRVKKKFYQKNDTHLSNEFIKGTPDLFTGRLITDADHVIDIKSSWDIFTFFRTKSKKINPLYYWQLQGYMALTGAKQATLAYCLINTPELFIEDEFRKLYYRMGRNEESPLYIEACEKTRLQMTYDDIPFKDRLLEYHIERDEEAIKTIYAKVKKGREFLNTIK